MTASDRVALILAAVQHGAPDPLAQADLWAAWCEDPTDNAFDVDDEPLDAILDAMREAFAR